MNVEVEMAKDLEADALKQKLRGHNLVVAGKGGGWKMKKVLRGKGAALRVVLGRDEVLLTTTPDQIEPK
jgi:hypothetical protein